MARERPSPIPLNIAATRKRWSTDPAFVEAYAALADEFAALGELVRARQLAGMTQADVAASMGIAQASVARLESSAGNRKHAHRSPRCAVTPTPSTAICTSRWHRSPVRRADRSRADIGRWSATASTASR